MQPLQSALFEETGIGATYAGLNMGQGKAIEHAGAGSNAHLCTQGVVACQFGERIREGLRISGRHDTAFDTITHEVPTAGNVSHNQGPGRGGGFQ